MNSEKAAKPRMFDVLVDENEVYVEIKHRSRGNEIIAISDIVKQIKSYEAEEIVNMSSSG
jgi:hypothetical protein